MFLSIREILMICLTIVLFWQFYVSIDKYFAGKITSTYEDRFQDEFVFPSVTFCPMIKNEIDHSGTNWSFTDEADSLKRFPRIVKAFAHRGQKKISMSDYAKGLSDPLFRKSWRDYIGMMHESLNTVLCQTYTPPAVTFPGGLASTASFYIDTRGTNNVIVYVHDDPRDFLSPSTLFGTTRLFMPKVPANCSGPVRTFLFKLSTTDIRRIPKYNYPCYSTPRMNIFDCIEEYKESEMGCRLPWWKGQELEVCSDRSQLESYTNLSSKIGNSSPREIYKLTGCHYSCNYLAFNMDLYSQDLDDTEQVEVVGYSIRLDVYHVAAAIKIQSEKYSFDFYDMLGNVGGLQALFLGYSLLNMYDYAKKRYDVLVIIAHEWQQHKLGKNQVTAFHI